MFRFTIHKEGLYKLQTQNDYRVVYCNHQLVGPVSVKTVTKFCLDVILTRIQYGPYTTLILTFDSTIGNNPTEKPLWFLKSK